jgi:hypothetical protein
VVERGPEKAGVGGSIPSLATIPINHLRHTAWKISPAFYHDLDLRYFPVHGVHEESLVDVALSVVLHNAGMPEKEAVKNRGTLSVKRKASASGA